MIFKTITNSVDCFEYKKEILINDSSCQHIRRLIKDNLIPLEDYEYDVKEGNIAIYNDTALEKFIEYSKENLRGRKRKDESETK